MRPADVRCTPHELRLLRPLDEMSPPVRLAVTRWLWQHDITPTRVSIGLAVERDTAQNLLVWREDQPDGSVTKRWRYASHDGLDVWPAPFPDTLADDVEHPAHADHHPGSHAGSHAGSHTSTVRAALGRRG